MQRRLNLGFWNFFQRMHFLSTATVFLYFIGNKVYVSGDKKYLFFGNIDVLCVLETRFWDSPFCLIPDDLWFSVGLDIRNLNIFYY